MRDDEWIARLEHDGFLAKGTDGQWHTTRRWHGALARASHMLYAEGQELVDLRTPIARALLEAYDDELDSSLATAVRMILPIATRELSQPLSG